MTSVAKTSIVLSGLGLMGSILSFAAQRAIAGTFGVGIEIDAYFVGNSLPTLIGGLLNGVMAYQVVPMLKHCGNEGGSVRDFQNALLQLCIVVGVILAIAGSGVSWLILRYYPNADAYCNNYAQWVAVIAWLGVWSGLLTAAMTAVCHVNGWFFRAVCIGYGPSLLTIAVCSWIAAHGGSTVLVAIGVLAGQVAGMSFLAFRMRDEISLAHHMHPALPQVSRRMATVPFVLCSMLVFTCFGAIDAYWAGRLDEGAVSTLAYAQRLIIALAGIGVNGAGVDMLPRFSEAAANSDKQKLLSDVGRTVRAIVLLMSPICVLVALLAIPTIGLLFEGGRFSPAETARLAALLPLFLVGMLPMSCCTIFFRAHYACRDIRGAAMIGMSGAFIYFLLSGLLMRMGGGLIGFGLAYLICWAGVLCLSFFRLWGWADGAALAGRGMRWVGQLAISLGLLAMLAWHFRGLLQLGAGGGFMLRMSEIVAAYVLLGLAFGIIAYFVGPPEIQSIFRTTYNGICRLTTRSARNL